jgi:hypothetical protein
MNVIEAVSGQYSKILQYTAFRVRKTGSNFPALKCLYKIVSTTSTTELDKDGIIMVVSVVFG